MRFSNKKQIISMTLFTAILFYGIFYGLKAPHEVVDTKNTGLRIWLNHMCCSGCGDEMQEVLEKTGHLGPMKLDLQSRQEADEHSKTTTEAGNWVYLSPDKIETLDFIRLDHEIRSEGLVAGKMEIHAPNGHLRLEAEVGHMCCKLCVSSAESELMRIRKTGTTLQWLDSVAVERTGHQEHGRIVAYARYLGQDDSVDVKEFMNALDAAGFNAVTIRAQFGEEGGIRTDNGPSPEVRQADPDDYEQ